MIDLDFQEFLILALIITNILLCYWIYLLGQRDELFGETIIGLARGEYEISMDDDDNIKITER
jgi:hypothetical protein